MSNVVAQIVGIIAYILLVASYYRKNKAQILFIQIFASLAFGIHYFMLSGLTGAICNIISLIMMIIIYFYDKSKRKNKKLLIAILIPVLIAISLLSWENIYSVFPIFSSTIMLVAFLLKNEKTIRIFGVISNLSWTVYGIIHMSYSSIIFEIFAVAGTAISLIKEKKSKNGANL